MKMVIQWYDRNNDFSANYEEKHHGTFIGTCADDCMSQYNAWRQNHDLAKFTPSEIVYIYD